MNINDWHDSEYTRNRVSGVPVGGKILAKNMNQRQLLALSMCLAMTAPVAAQDTTPQKNGVGYYGQQAPQRLYAPSTPATAATPQFQPAQVVPQAYAPRWQRAGMVVNGRQLPAGVMPPVYRPPVNMSGAPATAVNKQNKTAAAAKSSAPGIQASFFRLEVVSHGVRRQAICHLPSNYSPKARSPVILAFHGLGMTGAMMPPLTLLDLSADRYGFITVYPDAIGNRWDDGMGADVGDDVEFIQDLLVRLNKVASIDDNRVYACGISNGGYFTERLACESRHKIAAIAVVGSSAVSNVCARCGGNPVPAMFFLGTQDPLVPQDNEQRAVGALGEALGLPGGISLDGAVAKMAGMYTAGQTIEFWARKNGASASPHSQYLPDKSNDGCRVKLDEYGGGGNEVASYTIEGGGHTWPGGIGLAKGLMGRTTQDISASELMCQFFSRH